MTMPDDERKAMLAKVAEWRSRAVALDNAAGVLEVEDQHRETSTHRHTIAHLRAVAIAYRVCAADAEGVTVPF